MAKPPRALPKVVGRRPLIAGNWKMNCNHLEGIALVQKLIFSLNERHTQLVEVAVLPPFVDIRSVQTVIEGDRVPIAFGGQDLSPHDSGAYTGDVSGAMLAKLGCTFVTVGHSERREYHAESDELVNSKVLAAYRHGVTPILCVGESLDVRSSGDQVAHTTAQLTAALEGVTAEQAETLVVAYEPVWAIGTGEVATPDDAQEVCAALRAQLAELYSAPLADAVRVLYGGSVKSGNVAELLGRPDVDGALVGGASLDAAEFARICIAAGEVGAPTGPANGAVGPTG